VDCSDHEVNIKILLNAVVDDGDLTGKQRNLLLHEMTDEVARLVLRDNYEQNVLLGNARRQAASMLPVHARYIKALEASGALDRPLEHLPTDAELDQLAEEGKGLTSPELAVLMAYAKITLAHGLLGTDLPDEPWFQRVLRNYFPAELVKRYDSRLDAHPLRREIVTTCLVNDLVNRGGITFGFRAMEETGASFDHVVRAYAVCREIFDLDGYVAAVEALDAQVDTDAQTTLYLEFRRLLDRSTRWFLHNLRDDFDVAQEIDRFGAVVARWRGRVAELLQGAEKQRMLANAERMQKRGVPEGLAMRYAGLLDEYSLLDVTETALLDDVDADEVAELYFVLSERYGADAMLQRISQLDRTNRWEALARGALRDDLYAALEALTRTVLAQTEPAAAEERVRAWERGNSGQLARVRQTVEEVQRLDRVDLASLSVALRLLRGVLRAGSS
jgi:glutamate dehydrogenase